MPLTVYYGHHTCPQERALVELIVTFESHGNKSAYAGCYRKDDYVYDTPAEESAPFDYEKGRDTCTDAMQENNNSSEPAVNPIHNYMDYGDDSCLTQWTRGQITRMQTSYSKTRVNYARGKGKEIADAPVHLMALIVVEKGCGYNIQCIVGLEVVD